MKRPLILFLILNLIAAACSFSSQTPAAPLPPAEVVTVPPASISTQTVPASAPPTESAQTLLYISGTTHIESKPQTWPNVDAYLAFLQQVTALGVKWSVGADVGWLEREPRAAELIQKSEALGVQWDVHTHNPQDRARAAWLITQMGGHPTSVVSGMLVSELNGMGPQTYQGFTWTPRVLWGGTNCPGHRPGCDDTSAGVWMPLSAEQYTTHDPNGILIRVGGGTHQLQDARALAQAIENGQYSYPVISFTVMAAPVNLKVVKSEDGIQEIAAFVSEMNGYGFVRWANIEETAQAWVKAGSVPSRIEME